MTGLAAVGSRGSAVGAILEAAYQRFGPLPALHRGERPLTYAELGARVHRVASGLASLGLRSGDRVAIVSANCPEFIEAQQGMFVGGFISVTPSARLHADEVRGILEDCQARAVFAGPAWTAAIAGMRAQLPSLEHVVALGTPEPGATGYAELLDAGTDEPPDRLPDPGDLAALLYTSGTTGRPKGAMLTQANWAAMMRNSMVELRPIETDDVVLHVAPLSHFSGYVGPTYFARGASHVVLPSFEPAEIIETIERRGITTIPLVPAMLNMLLPDAEAGAHDFSSVRTIVYGGSVIAPDRLARAVRVFGDVFVQFFGLSETPMPLSALSPADHRFDAAAAPPPRLASAGRVNPFVELHVCDDEGRPVPTGEVGEIVVRGDTVMRGYWDNPEQTAEMIDADGWAATGDLGRFDDEGYLYIVDRKRDLIVTGGYNVYPNEVEHAIASLPEVHEVAVVGVPDPLWGEAIKAVVVARPECDLDADAVIAACRDRLADFKKPRSVEFVDELPKTGSGKIMRRRIRARYWADHDRSVG